MVDWEEMISRLEGNGHRGERTGEQSRGDNEQGDRDGDYRKVMVKKRKTIN